MNPGDYEAGVDLQTDPPSRARRPMLVLVSRIDDETEQCCDICEDEILVGEVMVHVSDGIGIDAYWHRRCLESTLLDVPIDEALAEARFTEVAEGWARAR